MKINEAGLNLLKTLEGCKLVAYKLKGETKYTIGYGHSDSSIKKGQTITQAQAEEYLIADLEKFEKYVEKNTKFNLNENQFSALVSYTYNRGYKGFKELMSITKTMSDLSDNIVKYWGSNTNYKSALIKRRKKEKALFDTPVNVSCETFFDIPTKTLRRGNMGTEVVKLQKCLMALGYPIELWGTFEDSTFRAVCDFQYKNKLVVDGIAGKHTRDILRTVLN